MDRSETSAKVMCALVAAQAQFETVKKDAQNPHLKNMYSTLSSVFTSIRPALREARLAIVQEASEESCKIRLITTIIHESGEWLSSSSLFPLVGIGGKELNPQVAGSAITYAKRYALMAMLGLAHWADDDDGHASSSDRRQVAPQRPVLAPMASEQAELSPAAQGALAGINRAADAAALGEVAKSFAALAISDGEKAFLRDAYRTRLGVIRGAK
jgi:hypothetical protein